MRFHFNHFTIPAVLFLLVLAGVTAFAHPVPDIPVRGFFNADGTAIIQVEVDPRAFTADPVSEPFLAKWVLEKSDQNEKNEFIRKARDLVKKSVRFRLQPLGIVEPEFEWNFTSHGNKTLEKTDDPVMITGEWKTKIPAGIEGYQIEATKDGKLSVVFVNQLKGKQVERLNVLFPGETSFLLDLTGMTAAEPTEPVAGSHSAGGGKWTTFIEYLRQGFVHVVPKGLDHIFFVLGVFLLSRRWRPLILQVTAFTIAHTITLALATLGWVSIPASVVEPVIAGSIAFVALENIFRPKYTHWRLLVVFFFGLIHGLGFAGALSELELPPTLLAIGLVGFNVGVEGGQLAVIAAAFTLTFWIKDKANYRKFIVIPVSIVIAVLGIWWMIERIV